MNKTHDLHGQILSKEQKKVYDKKSSHYGNIYYRVKALVEDKKIIVFVYSNLVSKQIFKDVEQNRYLEKNYLLTCTKRKGEGWVLQNWRELKSLTSHD